MNFISPTAAFRPIALPVNYEAEQAVLGAIMVHNKVFSQFSDILRADHFADENHQKIYTLLKTQIDQGKAATPVTIKTSFAQDDRLLELGGTEYLVRLCAAVPQLLHIRDYAESIIDCANRREIISSALDAIGEAETGELGFEEIAASLVSSVTRIDATTSGLISLDDSIDNVVEDLSSAEQKTVFPTGMRRFDNALAGGLYAGKFYGLSARHKVGKTGFLTSVSYSLLFASEKSCPHVYICGEMEPDEISQRLLARRLGINSMAFLELQARGSAYVNGVWMTRESLAEKVREVKADFAGKGLTFLKKPRLSIDVLKTTIAHAAMSGKYRGVIVDYLQMVTGQRKGQSQADHLDDVAQTCVEAAKQHGLWVIAAAQLNREGYVRGGDGLMNACDMAFVLNRQTDGNGGLLNEGWLEMSASRYTPYRHIGTEDAPGLRINPNIGPYFEELS